MPDAAEITVRPERTGERATVRSLVRLAFGEELPVRLLDRYYTGPGYEPELSLVAVRADTVVGHVMLTRVPLLLTGRGAVDVAMLSPLAVQPDAQGRGYGRRLVAEACARADADGYPMVVLEGNPRMYVKFGFEAASGHGVEQPARHIPEGAFQLRRLTAYDPSLRGAVFYPAGIWEEIDTTAP